MAKFYKNEQAIRDDLERVTKTREFLEHQMKVWNDVADILDPEEVEAARKATQFGLNRCDRRLKTINLRLARQPQIDRLMDHLTDKVAKRDKRFKN